MVIIVFFYRITLNIPKFFFFLFMFRRASCDFLDWVVCRPLLWKGNWGNSDISSPAIGSDYTPYRSRPVDYRQVLCWFSDSLMKGWSRPQGSLRCKGCKCCSDSTPGLRQRPASHPYWWYACPAGRCECEGRERRIVEIRKHQKRLKKRPCNCSGTFE